MITEILDYKYILDWDLDPLFVESNFVNNCQPKFPLVVNTTSGLTSPTKIQSDYYVHKKRRGKPSELRSCARDSLVSFVAEKLNLSGYVINSGAECSGSLYAIYTATALSYIHKCPALVFTADNQLVDDLSVWAFTSLGAMHQETGRSFDSSSKGFRMGTAACLFLVKHPEVKFSCPTIATISNYNFYTNPMLIANPGAGYDLIKNLVGINYKEIDLWNAHATGTPIGDKFEYDVFSNLIKGDNPIIGYKGHIGHCLAAAGGIEICLMLDDYKNNNLRPNILFDTPIVSDPRIITVNTSFTYRKILKANFGFGGKNVVCQINIQ